MSAPGRHAFGRTKDGRDAELIVLESGGLRASFTSFGAALIGLEVPDRHGARADVLLGFDTLEAYESAHNPYFGGLIGRCANRIAGARFTLDGTEFELSANEGAHHLHGGARGFDRHVWQVRVDELANSVEFSRRSPAGEEGYPGAVDVSATYQLMPGGELELRCHASCDAPTPLNLTQHSYFNLAGNGDISDHVLHVRAQRHVVVDDQLLPSGELRELDGGPLDLRRPRRLGECLETLVHTSAGGLDHCFVLDGERAQEALFACRLHEPRSGRVLEVFSTQPGLQVYTGNRLAGLTGKRGARYERHAGLCLETQAFPDAVHHENFPDIVLRPGNKYRTLTRWRFSAPR